MSGPIPPRILSLDLGQATGFATLGGDDGHAQVTSGNVRFKGDVDDRLLLFHDWLRQRLPSGAVACEAPFFRGRSSAGLFAMAGIVRLLAKQRAIPVFWYQPTELKKFTGSGRASKGDMLTWAREKTGRAIKSHDEADAVVLLHLFLDRKGSHWGLSSEEGSSTSGRISSG